MSKESSAAELLDAMVYAVIDRPGCTLVSHLGLTREETRDAIWDLFDAGFARFNEDGETYTLVPIIPPEPPTVPLPRPGQKFH